ncbi:hypothetical protein BDZ91DRAFT_800717 [Kalaharituber pfeilii]|nr:hypothetical protein BDZ91DRAFT_800717 [Kalaharituber pfeilii]
MSSNAESLPRNRGLGGRTAVVTGGRVNLKDLSYTQYQYTPEALGGDARRNADAPPSLTSTTSPATPPPEKKPYLSSWPQTYTQIPYRDLLSAHLINLFTPFLLTRELVPNLSLPRYDLPPPPPAPSSPPTSSTSHPANPSPPFSSGARASKTSALLREGYGIAINSIDTGFLRVDEEAEAGREDVDGAQGGDNQGEEDVAGVEPPPLGCEDAVGRALWAVARGERGQVWWGRFLKHYTSVRVEMPGEVPLARH